MKPKPRLRTEHPRYLEAQQKLRDRVVVPVGEALEPPRIPEKPPDALETRRKEFLKRLRAAKV